MENSDQVLPIKVELLLRKSLKKKIKSAFSLALVIAALLLS